jgi:cytoskeletal protein CcmA (bactofilin family)
MTTSRNRPGFALAVAMFAIVVIGAIVAGAFFSSTQEYRVGRNSLMQSRALATAELGMTQMYEAWRTSQAAQGPLAHRIQNDLDVGQTLAFQCPGTDCGITSTAALNGARADVTITRLTAATWEITSLGVQNPGRENETRRRTSMIVRHDTPDMNFLGAMTTRGQVRIDGAARIEGADQNPAGWENCDPTGAPKPGLAVDEAKDVMGDKCSTGSCTGEPPVLVSGQASLDQTYFEYGGTNWEKLKAQASKRYASGSTLTMIEPRYNADGTCAVNENLNWGDIDRTGVTPPACDGYFPVIYAQGNLNINGNVGQGILLVEGDLNIQGNFKFMGAVIVKGGLKMAGTGNHITGAVMAAAVEINDQSTLVGNQIITYSRCALTHALQNASPPRIATGRAWVDKL